MHDIIESVYVNLLDVSAVYVLIIIKSKVWFCWFNRSLYWFNGCLYWFTGSLYWCISRGTGQEPVPVRAGVRPVFGQPKLPQLFGSERIPQRATVHQLPEVPAVLEGARICKVPQVPPLPPHAGAAAV